MDALLPFLISGLGVGAVYALSGVGLVVLYRDEWEDRCFCPVLRVASGEVIWVQIACDDLGLDAKEIFVMTDTFFESSEGFQIFHITDMVTDEGVAVAGQAECIF